MTRMFVTSLLVLVPAVRALAQDVTMNIGFYPFDWYDDYKRLRGDIYSYSQNGVKVQYYADYDDMGACIHGTSKDYDLIITSTRPIAVIEMDGRCGGGSDTATHDVVSTVGALKVYPDETSVWTGSATNITFRGAQSSSRYYFKELRIWFEGSAYDKLYVADPTIEVKGGRVVFATPTPDATLSYSLRLDANIGSCVSTGRMRLDAPLLVKVRGEAEGYEHSVQVEATVSLSDLSGQPGNPDGDESFTPADLQPIIDEILQKNVAE